MINNIITAVKKMEQIMLGNANINGRYSIKEDFCEPQHTSQVKKEKQNYKSDDGRCW